MPLGFGTNLWASVPGRGGRSSEIDVPIHLLRSSHEPDYSRMKLLSSNAHANTARKCEKFHPLLGWTACLLFCAIPSVCRLR